MMSLSLFVEYLRTGSAQDFALPLIPNLPDSQAQHSVSAIRLRARQQIFASFIPVDLEIRHPG